MKNRFFAAFAMSAYLCAAAGPAAAQQTAAAPVSISTTSAVPNLISYSGTLKDAGGRALSSVSGVTFLLYRDEQGGAPLWLETQSVKPDATGRYSVQLGAANASGIPANLFVNGEPRWLAVKVSDQPESQRVLLVAVPYAMKAADAETIGGLPPSAFVLAAPPIGGAVSANGNATSPAVLPPASVTGSGTADFIPLWTSTSALTNSVLFQTGSGTAAKIGINSTTPAATLDVNGGATIRGLLNLPSSGNATASAGTISRPMGFVASAFNSTAGTSQNEVFHWQAEPVNNNTASASGTLNLLFSVAPAAAAETGLKINNKGQITFAAGQTFPGTGPGSVKSVALTAPSSDFTVTGSPVTSTGTLAFKWNVAPTAADTVDAIVKRDGSGSFTAGTVNATTLNLTTNLSIPESTLEFPAKVVSTGTTPTAIWGRANVTTGESWGTEGDTDSSAANAYGVVGFAEATTGTAIGTYGESASPTGIGVFGQNLTESATATNISTLMADIGISGGTGVWGDGGDSTTTDNVGVIGTSAFGGAATFANNSDTWITLYAANFNTTGFPFRVANLANGTICTVDASADFSCSGTVGTAIALDNGARQVAVASIQSPKNLFEDFGSAKLSHGAAVVTLDADFTQSVNTSQEYQVFLSPYGESKNLYVTNRTANSFEVHEVGGGTSNITFDYRIAALRRNFEAARFADRNIPMGATSKTGARAARSIVQPQSHNPVKKQAPAAARTASLRPAAAVAR